MSTWTFDTPRRLRVATCLVATVFLSACMGENGPFGFLEAPETGAKVLRDLPLYRGAVVVRAPKGYCVDTAHVTRRPAATVVPLATCSSLTGDGYSPVEPALMTVSVLPESPGAEQPSAEELAASLAPAEVTEAEDGDGVALVSVADGGQARLPDGDPRHWRGAMEVNGHLVGLAVYGPRGSDLSGRAGRRLTLDLAEALREASMKSAPVQAASSATGDE